MLKYFGQLFVHTHNSTEKDVRSHSISPQPFFWGCCHSSSHKLSILFCSSVLFVHIQKLKSRSNMFLLGLFRFGPKPNLSNRTTWNAVQMWGFRSTNSPAVRTQMDRIYLLQSSFLSCILIFFPKKKSCKFWDEYMTNLLFDDPK